MRHPSFLTVDDVAARSDHIVRMAETSQMMPDAEARLAHLTTCHAAYEEQMHMLERGVIKRLWLH